MVMVQVNMQGRENVVETLMLHLGKAFGEHPYVMIVDQGHGSDHDAVWAFRGFLDERVTDQVAKCFRAVGVTAPADQVVELLQERGIDGHANAAELAHSSVRVADWRAGGKRR